MERPTQTVELPISGLKAEVITYWTWSDKQEIAKAIIGDTTIDPTNKEVGEIKASNGIDLNKRALELGIKSLTDGNGNEVPVSEVFDLPNDDVELIVAKLQELDKGTKKN